MSSTPSRVRRRRALTATVATAVAALALAGCSASSSAENSTVENPSGELEIWYALPTSGSAAQNSELFEKYEVDPFTELHPDVSVKTLPISTNTIDQKIQVALAAGSGPDLVPTPGSSNAIPLATAGYFIDLADDIEESGLAESILPWALDMGTIDGKLQAIPASYETLVLYYNKSLFEDRGWEPPSDRTSLETLAAEMQDEDIIPFAAGNASYTGATEWLVSDFLNQVAGPSVLYSALTDEVPWTDPAIQESIQLLKDYFDEGYFAGGAEQYFSTQDPQKFAQLASRQAGMYLGGSWDASTLSGIFGQDGNTDQWGWVSLPALSDRMVPGTFPLSVGGTLSVNANAKNPNAAIAYIDWLFSDPKNGWAYAAATGNNPLPVSYTDADVPDDVDEQFAAIYAGLNEASEKSTVGYTTWTSFGAKAGAYIVDNEDKVLTGDLSIEDFCAGIDAAFQEDFDAGLIPPTFTTAG